MTTILHTGCLKDEYKSVHLYKEDENKGLYKVVYPTTALGFEMRRGLIVHVEDGTKSEGRVKEGDRLWAIEDKHVQGWSDEKLIKELMAHTQRPLTLTFLHPNNTNPDVRHGIVATETRHFHAVTKGHLSGLPSFASFAKGGPRRVGGGQKKNSSSNRSGNTPSDYAHSPPPLP